MKMLLGAFMWHDIYTFVHSQKAYDIYKVVFRNVHGRDGETIEDKEDEMTLSPHRYEIIRASFTDRNGKTRRIKNCITFFNAAKMEMIVSVNELGMVVVRKPLRPIFDYADEDKAFHKWHKEEELRNDRKDILGTLMRFSRWMKAQLKKRRIKLDEYALSTDFIFKLKGGDVAFSINDVDWLYYLVETEGRISNRGAEKRDRQKLEELLGDQNDFLMASCLRVFRDSWASIVKEYRISMKEAMKMDSVSKVPVKTFIEMTDRLLELSIPMGYSKEEVETEAELEWSKLMPSFAFEPLVF